ncbi:MAG: hypothetical protein E7663_00120 [Ruminococcaceae bacterium]|nr:hypothetical protein [Oscillospiraceae bacterium]
MKDNIIFSKIWQDDDVIELKVTCSSSVATITSKIYVSDPLIDELICQIKQFLDGNNEEGLWANEDKGNDSTACVSLRFFRKDKLGHIVIEVFAEIDDGGDYSEHNCCFYVSTEYGLLMSFCESLVQLKKNPVGYEIQLNCS